MGTQGALAYWMLNMISLFTGNLGRRGGNIYSVGIAPTTQFARRKPPQLRTVGGREISQAGGSWPAAMMADFIEDTELPMRALLMVSGNPLVSVTGEARLREAFQQLELVVCVDIYRSVTAELADYILPATDALEREDLNFLVTMGVDLEPYVQYTPAVVQPAGERRPEWWILSRIQQAMGRPSLLDESSPGPWGNIEALLASAGLSIEKLKALPAQTAVLPPAQPEHLFELGLQNDDGLVDCFPAELAAGIPRAEATLTALQAEPADQLKLITRRTPFMINSWMNNLPTLKQSVHNTNPLWMHPQDAERRDLFEGDRVRVSSGFGQVDAVLMFDEGLRLGVVAMTHGWGQKSAAGLKVASRHGGANVNALAPVGPDSFDPISNQSHTTGINVEVALNESGHGQQRVGGTK
jgi:anaerobic selenocysteine-containing dehydrogenase